MAQIGQELLNVPMGTMIESMAMAIAKAQWNLDKSSMTVAEMMSGRRVLRDLETGALIGGDGKGTKNPVVLDSRVYFGYSIDMVTTKDPIDPTKTITTPVRRPQLLSMLELGFTPTFYQFVDTIIEVKISISIRSETTTTKTSSTNVVENKDETESDYSSSHSYRGSSYWGWYHGYGSGSDYSSSSSRTDTNTVTTSQVNAAYTQKYGYTAEGSSLLRTKLVPIPPPAILEDRIREVMRIENAYEQWNILSGMLKSAQDALTGLTSGTDPYKQKQKEIDGIVANIDRALNTMTGGGSA